MIDSNEIKLRAALQGMLDIANDSKGVDGYHRSGNVAEWDEFQEVHAAREALAPPSIGTSGDQAPSDAADDSHTVYRQWLARNDYPHNKMRSLAFEYGFRAGRRVGFAAASELEPAAALQLVEHKAQSVSDNGAVGQTDCPKCGGFGQSDTDDDGMEPCAKCGETGKVPAEPMTVDAYQAKYAHIHRLNADERYGYECCWMELTGKTPAQAHGRSEAVAYPAMPEPLNSMVSGHVLRQILAFAEATVSLRAQRPAAPAAEAAAVAVTLPWPWTKPADVLEDAIVHIEGQQRLKDAIRLLIDAPAAAPDVAAIGEGAGTSAKDAARYRWLRDVSVPPHNFYLSVPEEFKDEKYSPAQVDAAIDAALAQQAAPAGGKRS